MKIGTICITLLTLKLSDGSKVADVTIHAFGEQDTIILSASTYAEAAALATKLERLIKHYTTEEVVLQEMTR